MSINFASKEATLASYQDPEHLDHFSSSGPLPDTGNRKPNIYDSISKWAIYVGLALIPLFFLPWGTNILELNKQLLLVIVAGVALVSWLLGVVVTGRVSVRFNAVDKGVLGIIIGTLSATIFSIARNLSIFGVNVALSESLVSIIALAVFYYVAVNVFDDKGKVARRIFAGSVIIALVLGLLQMSGVYLFKSLFAFTNSRAFNTVGSVNALGILAAIALPLLLKSKLYVHKLKYVDFTKIGAVVAVAIMAVINWWLVWAVACVGMLAVIAIDSVWASKASVQQGVKKYTMAKFVVPMTVIVLAVFLLIVKFNIPSISKNLPVEIAPTYKLSGEIIKSTLKDSVIFGYGPENFSIAFDRYGVKSLSNTTLSNLRFFDSTSQLFDFIIHGGVIMFLAVIFLFWTIVEAFIYAFRKMDMLEGDGNSAGFSGTASSLAAAVVAMCFYPFNLSLMFAFFVILGLFVLTIWGSQKKNWSIEEKPVVSLASSLGFIVGLILVLTGGYFMGVKYISDVTYAQALNLKDGNQIIQKIGKAMEWNDKDDRFYRASSQVVLGLLKEEINKKTVQGDTQKAQLIQNYMDTAINLARQATVVGPRDATNWSNLGSVLESLVGLKSGVEALAEEAYGKASDLRPGDASFFNQTGSMYLSRADFIRQLAKSAGNNASEFVKEYNDSLNKAESFFTKAIGVSSNYGTAIYNRAAVFDRQGKVNEAIKDIEKIIVANTNQPNLWFELGLLYYRSGQKDKSFAALQNAVLLAPDFANAKWYLALMLEERKDYDNAIKVLEDIKLKNQDNQVLIQKLEQLRAGQAQVPPKKVTDQKPL